MPRTRKQQRRLRIVVLVVVVAFGVLVIGGYVLSPG
jgi:hypothetical protein